MTNNYSVLVIGTGNIAKKHSNILKKKITGDSLVTSKKNIAIGILTADCAPILIFDPKKK